MPNIKRDIIAPFVFGSILSISIIVSAFLISKSKIYIKDLGAGITKEGEIANSISVSGNGKVFATPDMVEIRYTISEVRSKSKDAIEAVNANISKTKEILKSYKIAEKDIKTSDFSIYPEYEYKNNQNILVGQRATHSISVKVKNVDENAKIPSEIIDKLSEIENIRINTISFDIEDKTEYFKKARELAYQKAEQKAKELSSLSKVNLGKPISIIDESVEVTPTSQYYRAYAAYENALSEGANTSISTGQLEINISLKVQFAIE